MRQLLQSLRTGELSVAECPVPARPAGFVLVANRASLISAGTERATVLAAEASLIGKARQRPDKVRQVLDNIRKEGLLATVQKVREKLDQPKALGYSSAGVVLQCDPGETRFRAGDAVACGGQDYASHAEIVSVPRNLVVPLPGGVSYEAGAFATVGAIALQGVRRAGVELGHRVLVIGLGLLGQLSWQLLESAGCAVIGTDVSRGAVDAAQRLGLRRSLVRGQDDVEAACAALSDGHGMDSVIITASAQSNDPVELSCAVCRERGRVVVVGAVPMNVPREPFYRMELDLVISRSYGPGRYDPEYEEGGTDYPYGFVRWTEGRNMQSFLDAVASGGVNVEGLITHRFDFADVDRAYEIVSGKRDEAHIGIVLTYPEQVSTADRVAVGPVSGAGQQELRVGFVGAGSFARSYLLPNLKGQRGLRLVAVATAKGYTAVDAAKKFGFAEARGDAEGLVRDPGIDVVFIATRHDQHGPLARLALESGKHVFVEKPLAVNEQHLEPLVVAARSAGRVLQVGFNRRFSPLSVALRECLSRGSGPVQVSYRINAGALPQTHWLLDPLQGGGRIVGEGCHFIDLVQFLTGESPVRITVSRFGDDATGSASMILELTGGSLGAIVYQANGAARLAKERIEAFVGGRGGVIHDWRRLDLYEGRSEKSVKARGQAKGFAEEIAEFLAAVRSGQPAIPLESQFLTTAATFAALRSASDRVPVEISVPGDPAAGG